MSTRSLNRECILSSTTKSFFPKRRGMRTFVPNGNMLVAITPSRVRDPLAVMSGVSSVSSGELEYAVIYTLSVERFDFTGA